VGLYGDLSAQSSLAPTGHLLGGVITPSVASGTLTVAIKTLSGNDPSVSESVIIRIGDKTRRIVAPLSLSLDSGTNHMQAGSSLFADHEIDYFVYIGHRFSDDTLFLGVSRFPHYLDSAHASDGATAEKYLACSNTPSTTDPVENVGRFSASLSGTYAWTLSSSATVQRPIRTTRVLSYSPALDLGGAILSGYEEARYQIHDSFVRVDFYANGRSLSGAAGTIGVSLPVAINSYTITKFAILYTPTLGNTMGMMQAFSDRMVYNNGSSFADFAGNEATVYLRCNETFSIE